MFFDLCRQMMRHESSRENAHEPEEDYSKYDDNPPSSYRRKKRGRKRRDGSPRCVIL